jgi:hypothetical protein
MVGVVCRKGDVLELRESSDVCFFCSFSGDAFAGEINAIPYAIL